MALDFDPLYFQIASATPANNAHKVRSQKVKSQGHQLINAETEIVSPTNFKYW